MHCAKDVISTSLRRGNSHFKIEQVPIMVYGGKKQRTNCIHPSKRVST